MPETPVILRPDLDASIRSLRLTGADHHHLFRVLRRRRGDILELRDGRGLVALARVESVDRREARLRLESVAEPAPPDLPELRLALPLLKGRRLDWVLEKGTELGVAGFDLYLGRHGVVRRETAPARYAEVIAAAYCQSRRLLLPELAGPAPLPDQLAASGERGRRLWWADEERAGEPAAGWSELEAALREPGGIHQAWIGPEGGFAAEEREILAGAGATPLSLGPHRLRSETAALALAARILLPGAGPR
ncbi:MAG: 16S rRNA (uracil(1498)-N(3))-methyltransferase [Candidatus Krumholzibacteriota bacterium]|nr:16S rRNA (uracil(1498)-N(3))-methyltransferase [Candidatus Krumholzibacteriota bacterium]